MDYKISDFLYKTTAYLWCNSNTATGFFFKFNKYSNPVIVTNRHVALSVSGNLVFDPQPNITAPLTPQYHVLQNVQNEIIMHPNNNIDLAIIKIDKCLENIKNDNNEVSINYINELMIPTNEEWNSYHYIEDIIMLGCPNGIYINENNFPIARKGITATHPNTPIMGENKFFIDIAAEEGSSGSPVFLCSDKSFSDIAEIRLLGILNKTQVKDKIINIDSSQKIAWKENIHIGQIIKSTELLAFNNYF
jgi:hypothetical protein